MKIPSLATSFIIHKLRFPLGQLETPNNTPDLPRHSSRYCLLDITIRRESSESTRGQIHEEFQPNENPRFSMVL